MKNKKLLVLPVSAMMFVGLTGCGYNDDAAVQNRNNHGIQPVGYHSNENQTGNARVIDDNNGPLTEMLDYASGRHQNANYGLNVKYRNGTRSNSIQPLGGNTDRNMFLHDNRFSNSDVNYHGHLNDNTDRAKSSYYNAYEGELTERIADVTGSVRNVEDVRSVAYGSNVLIAVELSDPSQESLTKREIRGAVEPYLRGRSLTVVTDEGTFSRIRNIDNDLRNGGPREIIKTDLNNLFQTVGNRNSNNR